MPGNATITAIAPSSHKHTLVAFIVRALRPLAMLVLKRGMTVYEFNEISRWVFANAAMDKNQFSIKGRDAWSTTRARAAVLTGLTRREVNRLAGLPQPAVDEVRLQYHRCHRVLLAWQETAGYQDEAGQPIDLAVRGESRSLEQLVREHCRDITVRAMLDELEARGCVTKVDRNVVRFLNSNCSDYILAEEDARQLTEQVERFMSAAWHRLDADRQPSLAIGTAVERLSPEHRAAFLEHVRVSAHAFLRRMRSEAEDFSPSGATRARSAFVGVYCAVEEVEVEPSSLVTGKFNR